VSQASPAATWAATVVALAHDVCIASQMLGAM
jgi:hypothetical protein